MLQNTFSSRPSRSCQQDTHLGYSFTYFRSSFCVFDYINEESATVCFLCWCCKTFSGLKFKLSEYLKFLLNKQPCNQIYPFVTNIYRFLSTFWKLTVLFFFFVVVIWWFRLEPVNTEFFQYGENLNVQFLAFNDFLNSFFLDLLMNQVNHYQICFLFF